MKNKKSAPKKKIALSKNRKSKRLPPSKATSLAKKVRLSLEGIADQVTALFSTAPKDLISAIKKDHEGLRNFIGVLKDTHRPLEERRRAYALFSDLLKSHTEAEEKAVYAPIEKPADSDLVMRIEEGYVEHHVAEDVMSRMEKTSDPTIWGAHANVLAELVEHHLKEEEQEMFPMIRKQISSKLEADLIVEYLSLRASTQTKVTSKNIGALEVLQN